MSSQDGNRPGEQITEERRDEIFEALTSFITTQDQAELCDIINRLISPEILEYLQARLEELQTANDEEAALFHKTVLSFLLDAHETSVDAVVVRYLEEREKAIHALEALEEARDEEEGYHVLEEQQQVFLSDLALVFLIMLYYNMLEEEDDLVEAGRIKQHIDLLNEARIAGISAAWERMTAKVQQVLDALTLLEEQTTHETFYRVLEEKQELLITEQAIWLLQSHAADLRRQGDPMSEYYESHALLIEDAIRRNLADAWKDFAGVDLVIQELQQTDEPEEILKLLQKHEKVLRSEAALPVLQNYIARTKAADNQDMVHYFERWFRLLETARDSGITAAWSKFYNDLLVEIYGQLASSATQTIADYTAQLSGLAPGTLEWAEILSKRGSIYFSTVMATRGGKEMTDLAIADFSATLPIYQKYGKQDRYAENLDALGIARLLSLFLNQGEKVDVKRVIADLTVVLVGTVEDSYTPFHDPFGYRQQVIDHFTEALALFQQSGNEAAWVRTLLKRAATYQVGNPHPGSVEDTQCAINDYSAALTVLKKEITPAEWMAAIGNRGACYLQVMGDGYEERLQKAVADLEAALTVCTRQTTPGLYRKMQLYLYQAFERLGKWEEAYRAVREAIAVQRDLLAMYPAERSRMELISDVANVQVEIYVRAAQVLARCQRPQLQEVACLLEEGRTQNLRMMLSLDTLDPDQIDNPVARRQARIFLESLNRWRQHQHEMTGTLSSQSIVPSPGSLQKQEQLNQQTQEDYTAFHKAIEALRKHYDPDFMTPAPVFEDIVQAVSAPRTALVYLAAGAESGLALLVMRDGKGNQQTQYIPLPRLKTNTIFGLIETDTTKHLPIKLVQALSTPGELGLDDVVKALSRNGIQKVRLVPFGLLGLFPLPAALVQSIDKSKERLGDLFEVTIAPSARAIVAAEQRATSMNRATHPYLLLGGDPRPRLPSTKELPYAQAEADAVCKIAKRSGYAEDHIHHLRPTDLTKAKVVEVLKRTWYVHLAVHGLYQPDEPRRSFLLLAGNQDTSEEERCIFLGEALERKTANGRDTLNLEGVRLLVLSACESAIIDVKQAPDEVIGLAAGFLQAGAAGVIASLWAVDDLATYLLMSRFAQFYLDTQQHLSPAQALTRAQRWLREEATNRVLMTYDPLQETINGKTSSHMSKMPVSALRSLRSSYKSGLMDVRLQSAARAIHEPDVLPYADPMYWAAFVVTGC